MTELEKLDKILLSKEVVINFYKAYKNDERFRDWLLNVLPEVEDCENQKQNNPWHIYNVLGHILHSVEEVNKRTQNCENWKKRLLAYTMFLHDIGKPFCHVVREKDGEMIDSFFNHNEKSAEIAKRVADKFGFDRNGAMVLEILVKKHDIFMFIKDFVIPENKKQFWRRLNKELIKSEINDLNFAGNGKELFCCLLLVGYSDNAAQNPKVTKESLQLLDKISSMTKEMFQSNEM